MPNIDRLEMISTRILNAQELTGAIWRKSTRSRLGECVEVADLPHGFRAVRNSRDPNGPALTFTPGEWVAFTGGVKNNEFD